MTRRLATAAAVTALAVTALSGAIRAFAETQYQWQYYCPRHNSSGLWRDSRDEANKDGYNHSLLYNREGWDLRSRVKP